jgi:cytochrome c oxidase subunit 3
VLSREESVLRLSQAAYVVEGANLQEMSTGSKLFVDFFFSSLDFTDFTFYQGVIINIIIFFNVLVQKRKKLRDGREGGIIIALCRFSLVFVFTVSI